MSNHLTIEFCKDAAQFVFLKGDFVHRSHVVRFSSVHEREIKEQLDTAFREVSFLRDEFDEVTLSLSEKRSTLVPNNVFAESDPYSIFRLCFGKNTSKEEIDYNRISEIGIVNVFEMPVWVKSYFVIKFPRIVMQHEGTHILRKALHSNAFKLKATAVIYENYFQLSIVKHNQLEFYSFFDVQSAEDVIYHLFFVLQQKELVEKGSIELVKGISGTDSLISEVESGLKKIKDLSQTTVHISPDMVSKAQLLCV